MILDINAAINMRQYVKDNFPYILRLYRKYCRLKSIVYFRKIKDWSLQEVFEDAYKGMLHLESAYSRGARRQAEQFIALGNIVDDYLDFIGLSRYADQGGRRLRKA
jgi:hypothetical protein